MDVLYSKSNSEILRKIENLDPLDIIYKSIKNEFYPGIKLALRKGISEGRKFDILNYAIAEKKPEILKYLVSNGFVPYKKVYYREDKYLIFTCVPLALTIEDKNILKIIFDELKFDDIFDEIENDIINVLSYSSYDIIEYVHSIAPFKVSKQFIYDLKIKNNDE